MNWIEKLFGKKVQDPIEIKFEELHAWLTSSEDRLSGGRHAESVYSDIGEALDGISKSASELEKAEPEGRFHLKLVKIAISNRENMLKQVRLLMNNINIPKTTDLKTVVEFHENGMQTLTMCLENMMKSYQYSKMVFFEDSKKVIADVNGLGRLLNQLVEPINSNRKVLEAFDNAEKAILDIKNTCSRIDAEKKIINELEEKISNFKKNIDLNNDNLARLTNSEKWKQYTNSKNELVELENKAKKVESEINGLFLPLNKTFLRIKLLSEERKYELSPAIKSELLLCLTNPKSVCPEFCIEFEEIIRKDTVAFNPEKRGKILEQIMNAGANIRVLNKEYHTIIDNISSKKDEIAGMDIVMEYINLSSTITALQDNLASFEKEIDVSKKHLKSLEDGVALKKNELQQSVFAIDNRKKILY
ncbi:MAG: hypothetical protein KKG76_13270 [Euryarchaeota archaeon]|nr:hypothetical protein [Euryarchaeota archaeon]MBU4138447.1 hypothetical protein [Euryarchaeota archaeon]